MTVYRDATHAERVFVRSTWASSYKSAHAAGFFTSEDWPEFAHRTINRILDRPGTRTLVAARRSFLYGFICGDTSKAVPVVYYVYVRDPYRSEAIVNGAGEARRSGPRYARGLFAALGVDPHAPFLFTCRTSLVTRIAHKFPGGKFVPAAARYTNYQQQEQEDHER